MQPYARTLSKRFQAQDPTGLSATQPRPRPGACRPVPETWTGLAEGLTRALQDDPRAARKLSSMVDCLRLRLRVRWACGADAPRLDAWCGHAWCPACSRSTAARARESARTWGPGPVVVVEIPLGRPGVGSGGRSRSGVSALRLPSPESVTAARLAWGKLAAQVERESDLPRPEEFPRGVVTPDGLVLFLQGGREPERLAGQLQRLAHGVGLGRVSAQALSPEAAATRLHRALLLEAERFEALVQGDLSCLAGVDETGPSPRLVHRRWLDLSLERAGQKRSVHLGGAQALPLDTGHSLPTLPEEPPCPLHGAGCPVESLEVHDGHATSGDPLWTGDPEQLGGHPTRHTVSLFLERVRRAG